MRLVAAMGLAAVVLVPAPTPAGAATFGPVDPTLADGAPNSLRDIVINLATNAGGDEVDLQPGQTYTLTCAGGGALAHGNTPLTILTPPGPPATIQQSCPATPWFSHPGLAVLALVNLHFTGGSTALMSPACPGGTTSTRTWSTSNHTTTTRKDLPARDAFATRVLGIAPNGQVVFDQTTPNSPSSPQAQALFSAARAAVAASPSTAATVGPTLIASSDSSNTTETLVPTFNAFTTTQTSQLGPGVLLIGEDQSELFFNPATCTNNNDNTHVEHFVDDQFQTTVTHSATFQVTGITAVRFTG